MGLFVRALTRQNIVAIAVGVLVAGTPLVAFNFWLSGVIDRQGQEATVASAKRAVVFAEQQVAQVLSAIDGLAAVGVNSCGPAHVAALQHAAFVTPPIKEIAVVGPGGQTLCSNRSSEPGPRRILSSEGLSAAAGYGLDIVEVADSQHMVQLRRAAGPNVLAVLVPAALFLPQVAHRADPLGSYAMIKTAEGGFIDETGRPPDRKNRHFFVARQNSERFGFTVEVMTPRGGVMAGYANPKWAGLAIIAAIVAVLTAFGTLMPKNTPNNPMAELERALVAGEFVPYYQPIVDIRSGQLRGAEVLVRWRKPDGTLVLPGSFIPLAESSGLIRAMTFDLMRRVCVEAGEAIGRRPALKISFNFAGMLFSDETIVKDVRNTFAVSAIKLSQVVLEVTERDPIENFTLTRQVIAALQGLGVRIAIDDVDTGHSGLSYMLKLGVDIIKIDKMFVDAIGTDRNSTTIVETLVDLAHNMRMDVVAEGVENFEQVMHLRELGIRSAQGYVFAPPLPGSAFLQLVAAMDTLGAEEAGLAEPAAAPGAVVAA
ncbi:MAG: cyclic diguanylate phosphodiesterase [Pseudolabrys sp.]|nr:cyclic diguanylate phosphodiesterase [Pseudolabrys sp.]